MSIRVGQRVRVSERDHRGHHRTPAYVKGKVGVVAQVHDEHTNPETRAYGGSGLPKQGCYLVGFEQREVWRSYRGPAHDRIYVDVLRHWLEEVE
jgi:hypothetical protein